MKAQTLKPEPEPEVTAKPLRISVSQIKLKRRCERAYFYEYGEPQRKSPSTAKQEFGTEVHAVLENFKGKGIPLPETRAGRVASAGLKHLKPDEEIEVERNILIPVGDTGARILCRIDMLGTDAPYVGDHKTTSDFKWASSVYEVSHDLQLLTYAFAAYHESEPDEVEVELVYYRTQGLPVSMPVSSVVPWDRIVANWQEVCAEVPELQRIRDNKTGEGIVGNSAACGDYGGCFHCDVCPFSPQGLAKVITRDNITTSQEAHNQKTMKPTTKDQKTMKRTHQNLQNALGLGRILPPDAAPQDEQTDTLIAETGEKLKRALEEFSDSKGGAVTVNALQTFLTRRGVDTSHTARVLEIAGAIRVGGEIVLGGEPEPEQATSEDWDEKVIFDLGSDKLNAKAREKMAQKTAPTLSRAEFDAELDRQLEAQGLDPAEVLDDSPDPVEHATKQNRLNDRLSMVDKTTLFTLAGELAEAWPDGLAEADARLYCATRIAKNKNITARRWAFLIDASCYVLDGGWLFTEADEGFTEDPDEVEERQELTDTKGDSYKAPILVGKGKTKIKLTESGGALESLEAENEDLNERLDAAGNHIDTLERAALSAPLVVLVDAVFERTPPGVLTLSDFVAPYQDLVAEQNSSDFYDLAQYGKGNRQVLAKVLADLMDDPLEGVLLVSSREPLGEGVLQLLRRLEGVCIIRGTR